MSKCTKSVLHENYCLFNPLFAHYLLIRLSGQCPKQKRCKRSRLHRAKRNIVAVENSRCKSKENPFIFAPRKSRSDVRGRCPAFAWGLLGDFGCHVTPPIFALTESFIGRLFRFYNPSNSTHPNDSITK